MSHPVEKGAIDRVATLREEAARYGRRDTSDGPMWSLPSWDDIRWLLERLDAAEELARHQAAEIDQANAVLKEES